MTVAAPPVIRLSAPQHDVFTDAHRFRVLIAGRRFGKTMLAGVELFTLAWERDEANAWYVAPSYRQAKSIAWKPFKRLIPRDYIAATHETELSIELVNGSVIALKGADKPDSLRGSGIDRLVMDEFAFTQSDAFFEVLMPALADREGDGLFITSPTGFNWAYDLYLKGQGADPEWRSWAFTTLQGGRVSADEIAKARGTLSARQFRQEYEASFEALEGRVYGGFDRNPVPVGNLDASLIDLGGELHVGIDFNVNPMSAVIGQRGADEPQVLDAIQIQTSNTEELAAEIVRRYPKRRLIAFPDPSGRARRSSASAGVTDFTILERAGFEVRAPHAAPPVVDRINNTESLLRNADGRRRLRIHPQAGSLMKCLEGLVYKEGTRAPNKDSGLDHLPDALGYWLWDEFNTLAGREWSTFDFTP